MQFIKLCSYDKTNLGYLISSLVLSYMASLHTVGGEGGRLDLGKIRFCERSLEFAVRLYDTDGGSGGERGLLLISGDRCSDKKIYIESFEQANICSYSCILN